MSVTVEAHPLAIAARPGLSVTASVGASDPDAIEAVLDATAAALADHGLALADVVRTRLHAATRAGRDAASVVRFRRLAGPARCATSSYIDPSMFPSGDGVRFMTIAVAGAAADKIAVEYEPRQPPCRLVATGDLAFLSGVTSTEPDLAAQLAHIAPQIAESLRIAGEMIGCRVAPTGVTAWVHRSLTDADLAGLDARLGLSGPPLTLGRCDGYSAPGKLIEVEVDAAAVRASAGG